MNRYYFVSVDSPNYYWVVIAKNLNTARALMMAVDSTYYIRLRSLTEQVDVIAKQPCAGIITVAATC